MQTWRVTYTIRDGKGASSELLLYLRTVDHPSEQRENPVEFAQQFAEYLDVLITGRIAGIAVQANADLPPGLKSSPLPGSDVEEGLKVIYRTEGGFIFTHRIPTWNEDFVTTGGTATNDSEVEDLFQMMTDAVDLPANWLVYAVDRRGDAINVLVSTRENFVKSRR